MKNLTIENLKENQSVILVREGRKFIAQVSAVFACGTIGLILPHNPYKFRSTEKEGKLYSITTAFINEIFENNTYVSVK
jgi:hypothetical protein